MANRRMITSDIWEDDFFTSLSIFERLLWFGIITACADDQGRLQDNANIIRSRVFPTEDIPAAEIQGAIDTFVKAGKLDRYVVGGKHLLQIPTWWKHQTPAWAAYSNYPAPNGWTDRVRVHHGKKVHTLNWDKAGGYAPTAALPNDLPNDLRTDIQSTYVSPDVNVNGDVNGDIDSDIDSDDDGEVVPSPRPENDGGNSKSLNLQIWESIRPNTKPPNHALLDITVKESMRRNNHNPAVVAAEGKRFFQRWCNTKNKNGRFYSQDHIGWLEWWRAGKIPNSAGGSLTEYSP